MIKPQTLEYLKVDRANSEILDNSPTFFLTNSDVSATNQDSHPFPKEDDEPVAKAITVTKSNPNLKVATSEELFGPSNSQDQNLYESRRQMLDTSDIMSSIVSINEDSHNQVIILGLHASPS